MEKDLEKFRSVCNGQLSRAKEANNVIEEPFTNIPLDQVLLKYFFFLEDANVLFTRIVIV